VPGDFLFKSVNALHRNVVRVTGGRIGGRLKNMPTLELVTTGRKSGRPRSVMLTSPLQEGDTIVVVASAGGNDANPAWLLNIRANADVEVSYQAGERRKMRAVVADADERARLWPKILAVQPHYGGYQEKTDREIPIVKLEPIG
jgi:deazaflavin-dependent oxidoreductase (nitroreductase family)